MGCAQKVLLPGLVTSLRENDAVEIFNPESALRRSERMSDDAGKRRTCGELLHEVAHGSPAVRE